MSEIKITGRSLTRAEQLVLHEMKKLEEERERLLWNKEPEHLHKFHELRGLILTAVAATDDTIVFTLQSGAQYELYHSQDCCEHVYVEDVVGELADLVGSPITMAEEVVNDPALIPERTEEEIHWYDDSCTWTFYKLATINGYVTIRWFGSSNGYYSESVDWRKVGDLY